MYLILDSKKRITDICEHPNYVRRQKNGVITLSDKEHADAIYSDHTDAFWPIDKVGYLCEGHTVVEVETVPERVAAGYYYYHAGEFYTTEADLSALAKSKAPELANIAFVKLAETEQLDNNTIAEHSEQFSAWGVPISYSEKNICRYQDKLYRCLQGHTSQEDWAPDQATSLWKEIGDPTVEWPEWSQPIGAVDAYALGDKVSHNGKHWISSAANNVWEPGVYGWDEQTE